MRRGVAADYVGSVPPPLPPSAPPRSFIRSPADVTPGPPVLNDRCHCALKRLLPLDLSRELEEIDRRAPAGPGGPALA